MILGFLLLLSVVISPLNAQINYVKVKAKSGDGIQVLLGRYALDGGKCNLDLFCKLNQLNQNSYLIENKTYLLPIEKHRYDGVSIRSSLGINDYDVAKEIARFNTTMLRFQLKSEEYTKGSKELWCPHHLKACPPEFDKFIPSDRNYKIFGKEYESVPLVDKKLSGAVYYVVSGHGGPDPGAMSKVSGKSICEDEYAYDISLRLGRILLQHGAIVHFITQDKDGIRNSEILNCDSDEKVLGDKAIPADQKERLNQRSDIINELFHQYKNKGVNYQRTIEIHVDSRSKTERIDLFFYHYPDNNAGKELAEAMHQTIKSKYAIHRKNGQYSGTVSSRDLHVLRESIPTPVFVELANIQNEADLQRLLIPGNRQALADWLAEGLMKNY